MWNRYKSTNLKFDGAKRPGERQGGELALSNFLKTNHEPQALGNTLNSVHAKIKEY